MNVQQFRTEILQAAGAISSEVEELLTYNENHFKLEQLQESACLDVFLNDVSAFAPQIEAWKDYVSDSERVGVYSALKSRLVQLQFPIQAGISTTQQYQSVTRKGAVLDPKIARSSLHLKAENHLKLWIHPTLAGAIPVIVAGCREDFIALYQALAKRNEPVLVPASMGSCIISGYNNWDRVNRYKHQWQAQHPGQTTETEWLVEFQQLIPRKTHYQDQFILLSPGDYSGVSAANLGLPEAEWTAYSLQIRLEHECTHYCTRRFFNSMRNNALDELIADYMGIVAALGYYRSDWFLRFVGLEAFPVYRLGGRLENYRGTPQISDGAFRVLQILVKQAAENLERFDQQILTQDRTRSEKLAILIALAGLTLEELACSQGDKLIQTAVDHTLRSMSTR
ncbi:MULTISPECIES: DUF7005 family protein [Leptolyngbya]|uniref:DUF7005 family protein n=1 Tax=Leptolyngbya TaxID=47251 RepID=UPI00168664ED|nr:MULTISPECIES: hypothetical protein [unclassified Leptolyngbya]MBD1856109.1 hypothetical protein [Leptolyngbya sp. FACHB-1624]MCY6490338.1 hypothetical protein [Leptolyngbya sp. GGD]